MYRSLWLVLMLVLVACQERTSSTLSGYVEAESVRLAPSIGGRLTGLTVKRGDTIAIDQAVFTLDADNEQAAVNEASARLAQAQAQAADLDTGKRPSEIAALQASLESAQATLQSAALEFNRQQQLVRQGYLPVSNLDTYRAERDTAAARVRQAQADIKTAHLAGREQTRKAARDSVKAAEAALAQAQWQLLQKSVKATRAGVIDDTYYNVGEWVPAGNPVVSILPPENRKIRFFVPETRLGSLKLGQTLQVHCDGCGEPIAMKISYISPQAEYTPPVIYSKESRAKLVMMVEALPDIKDAARLHVGQPVDVSLP